MSTTTTTTTPDPGTEIYKGFEVITEDTEPPWGHLDYQLEKDLINTMLGNCANPVKNTVDGHKHYKFYADDESVLLVGSAGQLSLTGDLTVSSGLQILSFGYGILHSDVDGIVTSSDLISGISGYMTQFTDTDSIGIAPIYIFGSRISVGFLPEPTSTTTSAPPEETYHICINGGINIGVNVDPGDGNLAVLGTVLISSFSSSTTTTTADPMSVDNFVRSDSSGMLFTSPLSVSDISPFISGFVGALSQFDTSNSLTSSSLHTIFTSSIGLSGGGLYVGGYDQDPGNSNILVAGTILSNTPSGGIGYTTGAGSTITQLTSKITSVTINALCGTIITNNSELLSGQSARFLVNDNCLNSTDCVYIQCDSVDPAGNTTDYLVTTRVTTNDSWICNIKNISDGPLSEILTLKFVVIKAVIS
jgi:hypothetical protein